MERMPMVEHGVSQANITEVEETQKRLSLKPIAALSLSALALTGASGHNLAHESESGGFQITDGTWGGFKGYSHANQAPKRIQIWKAKILMHPKNGGLHNWDESRDCWEY
jgi:hypothetical protein